MKTTHKIIFADSRRMTEVPDESVHLVVTSPPYWQLKDYGNSSQIGFHDSYEEYINNLNLVWHQCHRILHQGCRLCVNIGDQFARSVYYGRYKVIPIRTEIIKFCEAAGFDYMGAIIWQKVTTCHTTGGATIMGSFPYPRTGILKLDYEFILIFKKPGLPPKAAKVIKEKSKLTIDEWNEYFAGHWHFPGEKQDKHLAMFPEELPKRLIKMFTFVGDTVIDPFLGSGTTTLAARNLGRNSIGYEINDQFQRVIEGKLGLDSMFDAQDVHFTMIKRAKPDGDFGNEIRKLPYIFKDPVRFDKKIDPRKLRFGSKIDNSVEKKADEFSVKDIISPELLVLGNDLRIRLLGIKEIPAKRANAMRFLREKTQGQRVFLTFDQEKYDTTNNLLCYLHLKNRTFINAHLVKSGLVNVDVDSDYQQKAKFLRLREAK